MKSVAKALAILGVLLLVSGCDSRVEKTDGGGVILSITDFDGVPTLVGINLLRLEGSLLVIDSIEIQALIRDQQGLNSDLMNVEMRSYQVTFTRGDGGTLLPPPLVNEIFGITPAGGTNTYNNLPVLTSDQLEARPLSDYFLENGGFDRETGRTTTALNLHIQFFGRSIAGEAVQSNVASFTVRFTS